MKRALVAGASALTVLVLTPAAPAQQPSADSVTGFTQVPQLNALNDVRVDARSDPAGQTPTGTFSASFSSLRFSSSFVATTVTCLTVSGNRAVLGGSGTLVQTGSDPQTKAFRLYVEDNGQPVFDPPILQSPDVVSYQFSDNNATSCVLPPTPPLASLPQEPRVGDLIVTDAPAVPTSKDQCKNGGWRQFGFRNQGQCVAFVQRGPKP